MDLAERIKLARDRTGLTQARAADLLGFSTASLAAYEQGSRDVPDAALEAMAKLYDTPAPWLRYGDEVLRAAATGEVERRIRDAARSLQLAATTLLAAVDDGGEATPPSDRDEALGASQEEARVEKSGAAPKAARRPRQKPA